MNDNSERPRWGSRGTRYDEPCACCGRETEIDNATELCRRCTGESRIDHGDAEPVVKGDGR